jgi:hypothetical protein
LALFCLKDDVDPALSGLQLGNIDAERTLARVKQKLEVNNNLALCHNPENIQICLQYIQFSQQYVALPPGVYHIASKRLRRRPCMSFDTHASPALTF